MSEACAEGLRLHPPAATSSTITTATAAAAAATCCNKGGSNDGGGINIECGLVNGDWTVSLGCCTERDIKSERHFHLHELGDN